MKGQASFEFMTIYGWVAIAVLIVIGALAYFGVLHPGLFFKEECDFGDKLVCEDFLVKSNLVNFTIRNNYRVNITIRDIISDPPLTCERENITAFGVGNVTCAVTLVEDTRLQMFPKVYFKRVGDGNPLHVLTGTLKGRVR